VSQSHYACFILCAASEQCGIGLDQYHILNGKPLDLHKRDIFPMYKFVCGLNRSSNFKLETSPKSKCCVEIVMKSHLTTFLIYCRLFLGFPQKN